MDKPYKNDTERADYWEKAYWDYMFHRSYGHQDYSRVAKERILKKITEVRFKEKEIQTRSLIETIHTLKDYNKRLEEQMKKIQEEQDIKDNIIDIAEARLALAAKDPPPPGGNWLSTLTKGTRFLAAMKNYPEPVLGDFVIGSDPQQMAAVYLGYDLSSREGGFKFFDPVAFSQKYRLFDIIQTEVQTDDSPEVPPGTVESDGEG